MPVVGQAMRREMAEQFAERPWYTSGSTLVLSRLTAPRCVLLGDAAHAVSAAFGQGVNSALEACPPLISATETSGHQFFPQASSRFNSQETVLWYASVLE